MHRRELDFDVTPIDLDMPDSGGPGLDFDVTPIDLDRPQRRPKKRPAKKADTVDRVTNTTTIGFGMWNPSPDGAGLYTVLAIRVTGVEIQYEKQEHTLLYPHPRGYCWRQRSYALHLGGELLDRADNTSFVSCDINLKPEEVRSVSITRNTSDMDPWEPGWRAPSSTARIMLEATPERIGSICAAVRR